MLTPAAARSAPVVPQRVPTDAPTRPETQIVTLLQQLAAGDVAGAGEEFGRLVRAGVPGDVFPAPLMTLLSALEVLLVAAAQTAEGPERELVHDSIRTVSRVARTMVTRPKVAA